MKKKVGIIKRALCIGLVFLLNINVMAAIVSDNDGSAFITKAEFDSLKNNFQAQIDSYNQSIDSKIDGAIASYLVGIKLSNEVALSDYLKEFISYYGLNSLAFKKGDYATNASNLTKINPRACGYAVAAPVELQGATGWCAWDVTDWKDRNTALCLYCDSTNDTISRVLDHHYVLNYMMNGCRSGQWSQSSSIINQGAYVSTVTRWEKFYLDRDLTRDGSVCFGNVGDTPRTFCYAFMKWMTDERKNGQDLVLSFESTTTDYYDNESDIYNVKMSTSVSTLKCEEMNWDNKNWGWVKLDPAWENQEVNGSKWNIYLSIDNTTGQHELKKSAKHNELKWRYLTSLGLPGDLKSGFPMYKLDKKGDLNMTFGLNVAATLTLINGSNTKNYNCVAGANNIVFQGCDPGWVLFKIVPTGSTNVQFSDIDGKLIVQS